MSDLQLERRFGPKFAAAFKTAPIGQWTGPLESPFGLHLVWLSQRIPAASPAFDSVRGRVVHDLLAEREAQQLERRIGQRRETYGQ
jgi:parvulin-like peptidyl-prolyl isomerase